jgi:hypothetical protein
MIRGLAQEARSKGVHRACLAHWIHRKYGDLVVIRVLHDGSLGTSLPCVICRKTLERHWIQWRAHIGSTWVRSTDEDVPDSRATQKQKHKLGFK